MTELLSERIMTRPLFSRNWEEDIRTVRIESCASDEDPLGYKAVFYLRRESERAAKNRSFVIGASFLAQRAHNLIKAGYKVPMTQRAISQVEKKIGDTLPMVDAEYLGRAT